MRGGGSRQPSPPAPRTVGTLICAFALVIFAVLLLPIALQLFAAASDSSMIELSAADRATLGLPASFGARARPGNPWAPRRTAHRVPGCGGRVTPSASLGDVLRVRYFLRDANGSVTDSTRGRAAATVHLGTGQGGALARALAGMCAGEAAVVDWEGGKKAFIAVESVGGGRGAQVAADAEREDRLARTVVAVPGLRRRNCVFACKMRGMMCAEEGFVIVNDCARLRKAFACKVCEVAAVGSAGKDMPCFVAKHAPQSFPRGFCLVSPVVRSSTCDARHPHTYRLCPCIGKAEGG